MTRAPVKTSAEDAAVRWHVRLISDAADDADWQAFEAWLDEAPEHGAAYRQVESLWAALDEAPKPRLRSAERTRPRRWRLPFALAASAVLAVGLGVFALRPSAPAPVIYQTAKGQIRQVVLSDGTRLRLNSGSRLSVALGPRDRQVALEEGEAAFDVAKDPARPFEVLAGDRQVRVVGTEFDVLRHDGRVEVAVRRGVVEVRAGGEGPPIARLVRSQTLDHREGASLDRIAAADPDRAFAWTASRLVYENARLQDVADDLNRNLPIPIVVEPEARDLRLTAVLDLDQEDAMLRRLAGFLPVRAVRESGAYRLEALPPQP